MRTGAWVVVRWVGAAVGLAAAGCGGGTDPALARYAEARLGEQAGLEGVLRLGASAPRAFVQGTAALVLLENAESAASQGNCPTITTRGEERVYSGGCTDAAGHTWFGEASRRGLRSDAPGRIVVEGFGRSVPWTCNGNPAEFRMELDGFLEVTGTQPDAAFELALTATTESANDACEPRSDATTWHYRGTRRMQGEVATFNGSGEVGSTTAGRARVSTRDEVVDMNACRTEALSGTTTLTSGGNTVVVTYDGATDCSPRSTVTWTLDGKPRGELSSVSCAASGGSAGALLWAAAALLPLLRPRRQD
jgi:hypothetical protein